MHTLSMCWRWAGRYTLSSEYLSRLDNRKKSVFLIHIYANTSADSVNNTSQVIIYAFTIFLENTARIIRV